jgi:hypothetical protein
MLEYKLVIIDECPDNMWETLKRVWADQPWVDQQPVVDGELDAGE